ncbi:YegP family protein [Parapedobacter tibetensis]|uniref:YegP family protein n=1 Tax=Parapedobacter tibetensis TaxID=2972951 RepID=UPI00214D522C|nr:YegP family protein [Parapedobacter tibetensis]
MGKFVIKTRKNGEFQFVLKAGNGEVILTSEGYTTKAACENGVASVKKNATDDSRYERKTAKNGSPFFNLKASNGQIIGTSEMYSATSGMENGIASVKKNAPDAVIVDETALGNTA